MLGWLYPLMAPYMGTCDFFQHNFQTNFYNFFKKLSCEKKFNPKISLKNLNHRKYPIDSIGMRRLGSGSLELIARV